MAIIKRLSLSGGGGILSTLQQAEQEPNTATILIGLGGTGMSALRTIKTQIYERLKPDDPSAVVPTYNHIRIIGIDSDGGSTGNKELSGDVDKEDTGSLLPLDNKEFFNISIEAVGKGGLIKNDDIEKRNELNWISADIDKLKFSGRGAGGIRQIGRYLMMDKSTEFLTRLEQEVNNAKMGFVNTASSKTTVNVHIFSGISGGTGAGCFLDVCYMVRKVLGSSANILGYFFLPDVNLAKIPNNQAQTREYVKKNGYASMQELDYCMNIEHNGGKFSQAYKNFKVIDWDNPPVDLCHLISATDRTGRVIPNAYDYVMQATSEYVMDYIMKSDDDFTVTSTLANVTMHFDTAEEKKPNGYNIHYLMLGASCASIPLKEINTYLAANIFAAYSNIRFKIPQQADVDNVALRAWVTNDYPSSDINKRIFDSMLFEMQRDIMPQYQRFGDDGIWTEVIDNDKGMLDFYDHQRANNQGLIKRNMENLTDLNNLSSLCNRLKNVLSGIVCNFNGGPKFAQNIIAGTNGYNLFNIISGLKVTNEEYLDLERQQAQLRWDEYNFTRNDFMNKPKKKKYLAYENAMINLLRHQQDIYLFEQTMVMLNKLEKQVKELNEGYYRILSILMDNLIDTFRENLTTLNEFKLNSDSFVMPLLTIDEIKENLDAEIQAKDIPGSFALLMRKLTEPGAEKTWTKDDAVAKLINEFFVKDVFSEFAGKTITAFLESKYNCNGQALVNMVKKEWMENLKAKAVALFAYDPSVHPVPLEKTAHISVPDDSTEIYQAADEVGKADNIPISKSGMRDRIFFMSLYEAFPLCSYMFVPEYEPIYYSSYSAGTHYYEGSKYDDKKYNDWRTMPPITPISKIDTTLSGVPDRIKTQISDFNQFYQKIIDNDLIFDDSFKSIIKKPSDVFVKDVDTLLNDIAACKASGMSDVSQVEAKKNEFNTRFNGLRDKMTTGEYLVKTDPEINLFWGGYAGDTAVKKTITKDNLFASPVLQIDVQDILNSIDDLRKKLDSVPGEIDAMSGNTADILKSLKKDYVDAVITGVIEVQRATVFYQKYEMGFPTEKIELSKMGDESCPYASVPIFQGFVSFGKMSAADRDAIKKEAGARMNGSDDEKLKAAFDNLANLLADEKIGAMIQMANSFDRKDEAKTFVVELKHTFDNYKVMFGF